MGQGPSTPNTIKTHPNSINNKDISDINDTKLLKYIKCNYYTAKEYKDIDKNLLPKHMCKIRKTVNLGNTKINNSTIRTNILKSLDYNTKKHGNNIEMYQFTMSPDQLQKLEQIIDNILLQFSKTIIGGKIPGPIYVAYSKILDYNGSYITRYCDKIKNDNNDLKKQFFTEIVNQLKNNNNKSIVDKTIYGRYVWKGNIDLIILIPNMNNLNKIHTNMFDYFIHNEISNYLVNHNFMNNIIPTDNSKVPKFLRKFANKESNFEHDSNNICYFHGCTTSSIEENINAILPNFSEDKSTMKANVKLTKVYLPNKCLRPIDYAKNGYNPKGDKIRNKFRFKYNVDYTDIVFEMIFCLAIDCMFKNSHKKNGIANRWDNYIKLLNKDPNLLQADEICDDHIILHMNSYIFECIKGTPPPEKKDDEDAVELAIKPIKIKKNHYTMWNNDVMKELAKRNKIFPGIQQFIYPFFQININKSLINNITFYLPWGNRLLTNKEFITNGELKTEIKSHNNTYSLFTNQYGEINLKKHNTIIKKFSSFRFPNGKYAISLTSDCKITVNTLNNDKAVVVNIKITEQTKYKLPLSLVISDNGNIIVYENGFNPIQLLTNFIVSNSSYTNDINNINKYGLWNYLSQSTDVSQSTKSTKSNESSQSNSSKYAKCEWITTEIEPFTNKQCNDKITILNEISDNNRLYSSNNNSKYYTNAKTIYESCKWNTNEIIQ